jgi:hypothetical protein
MSDAIVFLTGAYHLGNNPGVFQDATYVGLKLEFPATVTWGGDGADVVFTIYTHDVESWSGLGGHALKINGVQVGALIDADDAQHPNEIFQISVARAAFDAALNGAKQFTLGIEIKPSGAAALADDFVLTRIETAHFAARIGY